MVGIFDLAPVIILLPFISFLTALAIGNRLPKGGALTGITATGGSLLIAIATAVAVSGGRVYTATIYTWASGLDVVNLTFGSRQ